MKYLVALCLLLVGCASPAQLRPVAPYSAKVGLSRSMELAFPPGSKIFVSKADFFTTPLGTPIVVWWPARQMTVLHTLVDRRSDGSMVTKGDSNWRRDYFVTGPEDFIGTASLQHLLGINPQIQK